LTPKNRDRKLFSKKIPLPSREGVWGRGNLKGENDSPSPCPLPSRERE